MKTKTGGSSHRGRRGSDFRTASRCWDRGEHARAFRLFQSLAQTGDAASQLNVGYFFDNGIAVRKSQATALKWYRRAYANGAASAAHNIGTIFRDRGESRRAIEWFRRALKRGEEGSALELARQYLQTSPHHAMKYLRQVSASERVTEFDRDQADRLLADLVARRTVSGVR